MKNTISFILFLSMISLSCAAQKKISSLGDNSVVKAKSLNFNIKKSDSKVYIENTTNKFSNVKQSSPNLSLNLNLHTYIKIDFDQITKICASYISAKELEELAKVKNSYLFLRIISDIKGKPIEVQFLTDANSILSINQFEEVEKELLKATVVRINPDAEKFLKGSNYLPNDALIYFRDILKVKKAMR